MHSFWHGPLLQDMHMHLHNKNRYIHTAHTWPLFHSLKSGLAVRPADWAAAKKASCSLQEHQHQQVSTQETNTHTQHNKPRL